MLRISSQQKAVFDGADLEAFASRAATRIEREFPLDAAALGRPALLSFVRHGISRAERHGVVDEHGVDIYLNLMLLLGSDFDTDPQLAWVAPLKDPTAAQTAPLAERLHEGAREYLSKAGGEDFRYARSAFQRASEIRIDDSFAERVRHEGSPATGDPIALWLRSLYPEKTAYLGALSVAALVARARDGAARYGIREGIGIAHYASLMLLLGSGFDVDPAIPWAKQALDAAARADSSHRSATFIEATRVHLARYGR